MNFEERAYRTAVMWAHGMRSFDANDIFDYQNALHINRDYKLYLTAKREGLGQIHNPPVWLCRMLKREEGAPSALMKAIKSTLSRRQMIGMAVMTQCDLDTGEVARIFHTSRRAVQALIKRGYQRIAKKMGITEQQAKEILTKLRPEDWMEAELIIG